MKQNQDLTAQLVVRMSPGLRKKLERKAAERDRRLGDLVRLILRDWTQHEELKEAG